MHMRKLGSQGLQVSAVGLGCMGMSFAYGDADDTQSIGTLHRALDLSVNFWDTAEVYGPFTNERLIGQALQALKGRRDEVVVATKFGFDIAPETPQRRGPQRMVGVNSRPAHIRAVVEASLERLGIEAIDLLYQHRVDPAVPMEEVVGTMGDLVQQGKVRFLGLSEVSAATLRKAHAVHPISAVQSEYSLWSREPEAEVLPVCAELGIGFVPYSPLGRGALTGKLPAPGELSDDDFRRVCHGFRPMPGMPTSRWWPRCSAWRPSAASRRRSWRWPGCWRSRHPSCRFPVRGVSSTCVRMHSLPMWCSAVQSCLKLAPRWILRACRAAGTPKPRWLWLTVEWIFNPPLCRAVS